MPSAVILPSLQQLLALLVALLLLRPTGALTPPPPPTKSYVGSTLEMLRAGDFERLLANHASRYSSGLSRLSLPQYREVWLATTPELVREFAVERSEAYSDRDHRRDDDDGMKGDASAGIVASTGEEHKVHRAILNPAYFSQEAVATTILLSIAYAG